MGRYDKMGVVVDIHQARLHKHAKEYARIYVREGPRFAQYYARTKIRAQDREELHPLIKQEIERLRGNDAS